MSLFGSFCRVVTPQRLPPPHSAPEWVYPRLFVSPGRPKTDVEDCQWIRRPHGLGLPCASFRPEEGIRVWRGDQRHRAPLVADAARHIQRMRKALGQMNVELTEAVYAMPKHGQE